ncbi:Yip1-like protein [Albidovulum inexpectatum]|uniref:Yip1-like protein n=1 Tax=Albidovulum inexpectatum TaxID=196587 RepID=A0A2S5JE74_9RHOB|nr:Yip1 family protein [Albidovulum inexpectatum]PPB79711.1 Yip1-like protein [Albidovulum inexpectatum]
MRLTDFLRDLLVQTFREPRLAAQRLMALDLPVDARWAALGLVSILSVIETHLAVMILPRLGQSPAFLMMANPLTAALMQFATLAIVSAAIAQGGRIFGGNGRFADALILVAWVEFVLTIAQLVQTVALLLLPPIGLAVGIAALAVFVWLMVQFTAALHGFADAMKVLLGLVAGFILMAVAAAIVFSALGLVPQMPGG